jgi:electron transfer flavoprotein beta subunit
VVDEEKESAGAAEPLVVACLAPADLRPDVDLLSAEVRVDPRRADLSPPDTAALEHALRAGAAWGGRVVAVAAGPPSVEAGLRQALALGAGALRIPWGADEAAGGPEPELVSAAALAGDPDALARALAAGIASLGTAALVVCGDRASLRGTGAVPALLAHHLGGQQGLGLVSLQVDAGGLVGDRRLDGGWRQRLRLSPPAVISVEAAGVRLRRASLAAAMAAADAVIPVAATGPARPGPDRPRQTGRHAGPPRPYRPRTKVVAPPPGTTHDRLLALTGALVAHDPPRIVGPLDPDGAADELLDYLRRHRYREDE